MKTLGILTDDPKLGRKLELLLKEKYEIRAVTPEGARDCEVLLTDSDSYTVEHQRQVLLTRDSSVAGALHIPFGYDELFSAVERTDDIEDRGLTVAKEEPVAYLGNRKIKLTDVEYRLLSALLQADGFISREELLYRVWGGERDLGVVNVYVHYLREKLECEGEKVIISSRREGYKIDERLIRGSKC